MHHIKQQAWALFIVRLVVGSVFFLHGGQKVFGWLGGSGIAGFIDVVCAMGVPAWLGYLAIASEFIGGCSLLFGIAAECGALLAIPVMLGAIYLVHWPKGYFVPGGFEYPLNLLLLCIAVILGGPGTWYLWDPFKKWRS